MDETELLRAKIGVLHEQVFALQGAVAALAGIVAKLAPDEAWRVPASLDLLARDVATEPSRWSDPAGRERTVRELADMLRGVMAPPGAE